VSHTVQKIAHIGGCDTKSKMLRHPDRHIIVRKIISQKLLKAVNVLNDPNGGAWHQKRLATPLRLSNCDPSLLISSANITRFPPFDVS
jgi:hypothetical protein